MCPIYLDELGDSYIKLTCSHVFHLECYKQSQKVSNLCPYCRSENETEAGENDIWNYLINLVYYGHDISLIKYILDKYPSMIKFDYRKNYYDVHDKEHINYSLKEVVLECSRIDVLFLMCEKYNYSFLNNFNRFSDFSSKKFSKLSPNFKEKIIDILENTYHINSEFMTGIDNVLPKLQKLKLPNFDNAVSKFITNNFNMLVGYSCGGYSTYITSYLIKF